MNARPAVLLFFSCAVINAVAQGSLTPPGAPEATMKTLQQVEPRTPISSLPYTITNSGSYYATTNLGSGFGGGITIRTNNVVVDLGGFTLTGPGVGISVPLRSRNIVVRNGTLRNWGWAVLADSAIESSFERLTLTGNVVGGMTVGDHCQVIGCIATLNTNVGISTGEYATITDCNASGNTVNGIVAGANCQITGSIASSNVHGGIFAGAYAIVSRCLASSNFTGIFVVDGSRILECTAVGNKANGVMFGRGSCAIQDSLVKGNGVSGIWSENGGNTVRNCNVQNNSQHGVTLAGCCNVIAGCNIIENGWNGVVVENRSQVSGNLIHFNGQATNNGANIRLEAEGNRVEDNTVADADVGILALGANLIIRNHALSNTTNYHFLVTQNAGPIIGTGTIVTNNPWANFSH